MSENELSEIINETNEEEDNWETLKNHEDYEICKNYPHQIRKKSNKYIISEHEDKDGYIICSNIDGKQRKKHRLIAFQWIPNPDNLPQVDHKNRIPNDNHIENLRFVSNRENGKNRGHYKEIKFDFLDEIPSEAIKVDEYNNNEFEGLYFHEDKFYQFNGIQYRKLLIRESATNIKMVRAYDVNGIRRTIYYTKFKREYDI